MPTEVLTVEESKGLEFNDVLLFNFFADSSSDLGKWSAVLHEHERDMRASRLGSEHKACALPLPSSDPAVLMSLNDELKHLYVALTRARRRVILYDNTELRIPVFELLARRGLGTVVAVEDLVPEQASGENWLQEESQSWEWLQRGRELLEMRAWEEAAKCFRKAGDQRAEMAALGHWHRERGEATEAGTRVSRRRRRAGSCCLTRATALWSRATRQSRTSASRRRVRRRMPRLRRRLSPDSANLNDVRHTSLLDSRNSVDITIQ